MKPVLSVSIDYLADHPEFIPVLARWHHGEWSALNPGDTVEKRIARLQRHLGRSQVPTTFVALSEGELVGSASLVEHDMDTRMEFFPWLASVYVTPEFRNRGVGSSLVQRVVEEAKVLGFRTLYLFTPDRESFYVRLGWSLLEHTKYRGCLVTLMELSLVS